MNFGNNLEKTRRGLNWKALLTILTGLAAFSFGDKAIAQEKVSPAKKAKPSTSVSDTTELKTDSTKVSPSDTLGLDSYIKSKALSDSADIELEETRKDLRKSIERSTRSLVEAVNANINLSSTQPDSTALVTLKTKEEQVLARIQRLKILYSEMGEETPQESLTQLENLLTLIRRHINDRTK